MLTMYGIPNCDTIKKARRWLEQHNIEYRFHDYRKDGIATAMLQKWCAQFGHDALINRRGTTWRSLPPAQKDNLSESKAIALMQSHPAMIKRPLLDTGSKRLLGFDPSNYESLL